MLTLICVLVMLALGRLVGPVHPDVAAALLVLAAVCLVPAAWADLAPIEGEYRAAFPAAVAYSIATAVYLGGLAQFAVMVDGLIGGGTAAAGPLRWAVGLAVLVVAPGALLAAPGVKLGREWYYARRGG